MLENCGHPDLKVFYLKLRKGLDTVESLSVEVKGSKNPGKRFLVL